MACSLLERSVWDQHLRDGQQYVPLRISKQAHGRTNRTEGVEVGEDQI